MGGEGSGGLAGGSRQEQQPFFKCHVRHCPKVASLTLKDSYED